MPEQEYFTETVDHQFQDYAPRRRVAGILVTRLWYIREVEPYAKVFTGMTRGGTFLVEGGRVTAGVRNFRFNVGLMEMLSNVEAIG